MSTELFRKGGDLWAAVPLPALDLDSFWRTAAVEVMSIIITKQRADELDERLTDRRIAEALGRSESFVQKGLFALQNLPRLIDGARVVCKQGAGIIDRAREQGRRGITLIRGLATRGTKADPPAPPDENQENTTTDTQDTGSSPSSPPPIGPEDPTVLRAIRLIPEATHPRVAAAISVYSAEWVTRALDQVERRNRKPGMKPVRTWIFVLRVLDNWSKEGGPPAEVPTTPPATPKMAPKAPPEDEAEATRTARTIAAWEALPEAERDAIRAAVQQANPLIRWPYLLEPLYLAELERRL